MERLYIQQVESNDVAGSPARNDSGVGGAEVQKNESVTPPEDFHEPLPQEQGDALPTEKLYVKDDIDFGNADIKVEEGQNSIPYGRLDKYTSVKELEAKGFPVPPVFESTEDHRNGNNHLVARREMQENAAQVRHIVASLSSNPTSEAPAGHVGNNHESTDPEPAPHTELPPTPPQKPPSGGGEIATMEPEGDDEQKASKPEVTKPDATAHTEASTDTELQTLLTDFEPYRAHETSSFYFIPDREAADQFVERLQTGNIPYGIEFGPGEIPSKLSEIDPNVPLWVAFEPDGTAVVYAMETVDYLEKAGRMVESNKVVYVQKGMDKSNIQSDIPGLQTVVYRNSDYREFIPFPDKDFVENGKRVVMINDGTHLPEAGYYQNFLQEKGIPKEEFVHTEQDLSHIPWDHTPESYVYDSKGELTSAQTTENVTEANIQSKTEGNKESNDTDNPPASPPPELPPPPPQKPPSGGGEIAAMEPEGDDEQKASKPEATKPETSAPTEAVTDTELQTLLTDLEPYRAHETSSFYFISDTIKAQEVIQILEAGNVPYGIEFGPGYSVSKLNEIEPGVSVWLAFEPDQQQFERAERRTELYEKNGILNEPNQIVYLQEYLRQHNIRSDIPGLKAVVYRNPDYRYDVPFPDQEFRENKRVVLINDSVHIGEENQYRDFLGWHGISSDQLVFIERNLNNSGWDKTEESYVYDSTSPLIQSKKEAIEQLLKEARENSTDSSSAETESEQEPVGGDNATEGNDDSQQTPPSELPPPPPQKPPSGGG